MRVVPELLALCLAWLDQRIGGLNAGVAAPGPQRGRTGSRRRFGSSPGGGLAEPGQHLLAVGVAVEPGEALCFLLAGVA